MIVQFLRRAFKPFIEPPDEAAVLVVGARSATAPIRQALERAGHPCRESGLSEGWRRLCAGPYAALVVDLDGAGTADGEAERLVTSARRRHPELAILVVADAARRRAAFAGLAWGAWGYLTRPFDGEEAAAQLAAALDRRRVQRELAACRRACTALTVAGAGAGVSAAGPADGRDDARGAEVAGSLAAAVQYRDGETGAHLARVGLYSAALARELGWGDEGAIEDLRVAAGIHDVGKLGVPDQVLLKPAPLTAGEKALMQRHTEIGAAIIGDSELPVLRLGREIALCHHERWDGSGYPGGLAGDEIPIAARIVAVADVYDSLVHSRVYRPPMEEDEALELMAGRAGTHFDPQVFDSFFDLLPQVRRIQRELAG